MERYKNYSKETGEIFYECGENYITLVFEKDGKRVKYHYSIKSMRLGDIKHMCMLARQGSGLRSYIHSKETSYLVKHEYEEIL